MAKIDRNSVEDARMVFEKLLPYEYTRSHIIDFLSDAIVYAKTIDADNWNLNLDLKGGSIQFNVGMQYCIRIDRKELLIICDRTILKPIIANYKIPVKFRGHIGNNPVNSDNIDQVPDCLARTKNSIGCFFPITGEEMYLAFFKSSNKAFIREAIKTKQIVRMRTAHSIGVVKYLDSICLKKVIDHNDDYIDKFKIFPDLKEFVENEKEAISKARKLNPKQRQKFLKASDPKPKKTIVSQTVFDRNPYVVAEVLDRANGKCERCNKNAPFNKDTDGTPYLEVHHKIPLSEGGEDTVENAIGLCPNCHRHAHYGTDTY